MRRLGHLRNKYFLSWPNWNIFRKSTCKMPIYLIAVLLTVHKNTLSPMWDVIVLTPDHSFSIYFTVGDYDSLGRVGWVT